MSQNSLRVAIRKYDPFEAAIRQAWESFVKTERVELTLDAVQMDLDPLHKTIFDEQSADVVFFVTDWFATAKESGVLLDLAPLIKATPPSGWPAAWPKSLLGMQQFGDAIYGLPYHDGPECFIYRRDLFDDPAEQAAYRANYGSDLRVPTTWQEFHQVAQFFTRPEQNLYGTVFAAFPDGHNTVYDFCIQLWTRGGELFDANQRMQLDTPQAIDALKFYRAILNDQSAIHPKAREFDSVKSGLSFLAGEIAMMVNWFGFATLCDTSPDSGIKGKVNIAPIPASAGGKPLSLSVYWTLSIMANSPHKELAYRFIRHCMEAEQDKFLTLAGAIGCRTSTWHDAEVNAQIPYYHRLSTLHENARELPRLAHWDDLAKIIDELVVRVISTDDPIEQIVKTMQAKVP
ncbi:MAG: extracellular solute-binding protein [Anaerolineae bacterium]|nr:extracellular solute-binding protein [Anaerolineae bacterium]